VVVDGTDIGTIIVFVGGWFEFKSGYPVYEVFRMMSVCASVCPTFRSPTITQKRFDRLLSNLTNTNLPVVARVEKLLVSIGPRGVEEDGGRSKK
jgi:hypothetical protein